MANRRGKKLKAVTDLIFLVSKITADCNFTHKIKRHLFLERKIMANLVCMCVCVCTHVCMHSVTHLCQTLCDPIYYSLPGSFVHGIFPTRLLECGLPFPPPGSLPDPGVRPVSLAFPALARGVFTPEPLGSMTNLDSVLKSRGITLLAIIHIVKVAVFPVVVYRCESWIMRKAEPWRIDAFELWCWRTMVLEKTLKLWCWRVPWTARRSNQSIQKEINPEYSLEDMKLKLQLQYFGQLIWRANSLEKTLMLGNIEGRRRSVWQRVRWLDKIMDSIDLTLGKLWEMVKNKKPGMLQSMGSQRVGHDLVMNNTNNSVNFMETLLRIVLLSQLSPHIFTTFC